MRRVVAGENPRDPYEGFNRAMFNLNDAIDTYTAKPVAQAYDAVTPLPVKAGLATFFGNVGDLWIGVNSALQGKFGDAGGDFGRLAINSTIGIFGLFDVASELGSRKSTKRILVRPLAVWGLVMVDICSGHSLVRVPYVIQRVGRVDSYFDPVWRVRPIATRNSLVALRFVDIRASLLPADKIVDEAAIDVIPMYVMRICSVVVTRYLMADHHDLKINCFFFSG